MDAVRNAGKGAGSTVLLGIWATLFVMLAGCASTPGPTAPPVGGPSPVASGAPERASRIQPPVPTPAPLPSGLVLPPVRLHVVVDDDVDPDALRGLAQPGTTVWLETRSNMLRESTVEALAGFDSVFVRVRPPLLEPQLRQLRRLPRAGLWIRLADADALRVFRLGPRPLAVEGRGVLDAERIAELGSLRPSEVQWEGAVNPDVWSALATLRGRKVVHLSGEGAWPCTEDGNADPVPPPALRGLWLGATTDAPEGLLHRPLPACGLPLRVRLLGPPSDAELARIFSRRPLTELEVAVESDPESVRAVQRLQARLAAAQARAPSNGAATSVPPAPPPDDLPPPSWNAGREPASAFRSGGDEPGFSGGGTP